MKPSWIVLTMGDRPQELEACLESIRAQRPAGQIVVVYNGANPETTPAGVDVVTSQDNRGIPGGRNLGADRANGEILFFLDDDATVATPNLVQRVLSRFAEDPKLCVVSFRIADQTGESSRRHVPRLRTSDPRQTFYSTTFLGGACAIRRTAFELVGRYSARFFYAHEETDLSWRLLDHGYRILYDGEMVVSHPRTTTARHRSAIRLSARNRVWLARRRLPIPLVPIYTLTWLFIQLVRSRSLNEIRSLLSGTIEGISVPAGKRSPMSWSTVVTMTRLGRPPFI